MHSVLIIEDDPAYRSMIETILRMEGFETLSAPDARVALDLLRKNRVDLILCDIMLPGMDGHGLLENLQDRPLLAAIPFIFVTALAERSDVRRGMSAGADDYLLKPFTAEELLAAVTGRINRHEMIRLHCGESEHQAEQATLRARITARETEVLLLVGKGATSRIIAEKLGLSMKTVEVHRANLMKKLGAANAACLSRWALIAEKMPAEP